MADPIDYNYLPLDPTTRLALQGGSVVLGGVQHYGGEIAITAKQIGGDLADEVMNNPTARNLLGTKLVTGLAPYVPALKAAGADVIGIGALPAQTFYDVEEYHRLKNAPRSEQVILGGVHTGSTVLNTVTTVKTVIKYWPKLRALAGGGEALAVEEGAAEGTAAVTGTVGVAAIALPAAAIATAATTGYLLYNSSNVQEIERNHAESMKKIVRDLPDANGRGGYSNLQAQANNLDSMARWARDNQATAGDPDSRAALGKLSQNHFTYDGLSVEKQGNSERTLYNVDLKNRDNQVQLRTYLENQRNLTMQMMRESDVQLGGALDNTTRLRAHSAQEETLAQLNAAMSELNTLQLQSYKELTPAQTAKAKADILLGKTKPEVRAYNFTLQGDTFRGSSEIGPGGVVDPHSGTEPAIPKGVMDEFNYYKSQGMNPPVIKRYYHGDHGIVEVAFNMTDPSMRTRAPDMDTFTTPVSTPRNAQNQKGAGQHPPA